MPDRYRTPCNLRQLRAFLAVAEHRGFRQAAEALHLAQPALSRQVKQLEEALDCALLVRDARGVTLTPAGAQLYECLPPVFERLHEALDRTTKVAAGETVSLKIGYSAAAMSSFLPSVIRGVHRHLPGCVFDFAEETSDRLIEGVINQRLDAAFILYRPTNPLLRTLPVRSEPMGVVLPSDHALAVQDQVALHQLRGETLVLFPRAMNPVMHDEILAACQAAGFTPHHVREVAPRSIAIGLVAAGAGVATIASSLGHQCVDGTCYRPLIPPAPQIRFSCIHRRDAQGNWIEVLENVVAGPLR